MYKQAVEVWFSFYRERTGQEYVFDGKDGRHLKQLIKKIESKVKEKKIEATEENILNSLRGLLANVSDQWILDNLEIALVNSKFNSIYAKAVKQNPFSRANNIREMVRKEYGPDSKRTA